MSEPNPSLEEHLFEAALSKSSEEECSAFLDSVCRGNPGLRARLGQLLEGHFQAQGFLQGAGESIPPKPAGPPVEDQPASTFIGRYKLLEKIGEGGFGEVWMAEQKEPVKRRVALKIIKLGMDTKQVVARFEIERQALAMMDHPNIAKVLDAGATDTGRPYFVMDLVRGERITEYCDQNRLPTTKRLKLFTQVCRAIQHAHQKGIIHRDIKPSNILVTLNDGVPVPKVIDFGIAKATQQELTDKTVFTQFRQFIGTPAYVSPEQAQMSSIDVDTRSDIYSLGVLLYELLTGKTPFDTRELLATGLDELRRRITEMEPVRPSTRLSSMAKEELTTTAQRRAAEPPKLINQVRGDLDWIVMKCLEKDRTRRYETANGLAKDIERHLGHEPVLARPPSRTYEFRKSVRRHWLGFAAAGAVALTLVAGAVVSTLYGHWAKQAGAGEAKARSLAEQNLFVAKLAEARAKRLSGIAGQRFESLAAIAEAAKIHSSRALSDEAVACLALTDLRLFKSIAMPSRWVAEGVGIDSRLELYAYETNGALCVHRMVDGQEMQIIPVKEANTLATALWGLRFDPKSRYLTARVMRGNDHEFRDHDQINWRVWDLTLGGEVVLEIPGEAANFSPDGEKLAISQVDGEISIRELVSSKELQRLKTGGRLSQLCFSPDGGRIAGFEEGSSTVRIWDVESGQLELSLLDSNRIHSLAWSPDGTLLASGTETGQINLWNVRHGKLQMRLEGHSGVVDALAFDHQANLLASSGWDVTTRLWDPGSGKQLVVWPNGNAPSMHFSQDDRLLAGFSDGPDCQLLEVARPTGYRRLSHLARTASFRLDFTPDWRVAAVAGEAGILFIDVGSGKGIEVGGTDSRALHLSGAPNCALWTCTGAGLSRTPLNFYSDGGQPLLRIGPGELLQPLGGLGSFAFDRENRRVVMTKILSDGAFLWDLGEPEPARRFCFHPMAGFSAMDPAGKWAATGTWKGDGAKVWDFNTGHLIKELPVHGSANVACSPDGRWLATAGEADFRLWDTRSWSAAPHILSARSLRLVGLMAFSPDSRLLATCHDEREIKIITVPELQSVASLLLPLAVNVSDLCFGPSGDKLAVLEWTGNIHMWDLGAVRSGLKTNSLDWDLPPFAPGTNLISGSSPEIVFDPSPFSRQELAALITRRDTDAPANLIDLSAYYNAPLTIGWDGPDKRNDLSELPRGLQTFAGIRFDIRGLIQIGAQGPNGLRYPTHVRGIPIGRSCDRLHFLHAAGRAFGAQRGDELGSYVIHYEDGRQIEIPIVVGKDLADWWPQPNETNMSFVVAWTGSNQSVRAFNGTIRLFKTTWENPRPTVPIRQLDFVYDKPAPGQPFLVAVTAEP